MIRNFSLLFLSFFAILSVNAQGVDRTTARTIAQDFLKSQGRQVELAPEAATGFNGQRKATKTGHSPLYLFNIENEGGFVVVSGDERTEQVLGYVDKGSCDDDNMPDNMKAWLQMYAQQIESLPVDYAPSANAKAADTPKKAERKAIGALVKTKWNQGEPYNLKCPMDGGSRSVTGCVATALAQIMYYHKWPQEATTTIPSYYVLNQWLPELPATTFNWDKMLLNYDNGGTTAQRNAVAELMFYCGQAVEMGYSAAGSGAFSGNVKTAILKYFDYDGTAKFVHRSDYSIAGWDALIYNELYESRPVYYAGYSPGGHAFVCDGYDTAGFFHFNWGWGGWDDGYFRLSLLNADDPMSDGMSATGIGFSMGQECVIGIQPQAGTPAAVDTHLTINDTEIRNGTQIFSNYVNWTGSSGSFNGAIVMQDENGEYKAISNIQTANNLGANYYMGWTFNLAGKLPEGQHKVSPASKLTSSDVWIPLYNLENNYILADVDANGNMTLTKHPIRNIGKVSFEMQSSCVANTDQKVAIKVDNAGDEYNGEVCLYASKTTDKGEELCKTQLEVPAYGSNTIYMFFKPETDGEYTLWLTTNDKNDVLGSANIRIGGKTKLTGKGGTAGFSGEAYSNLFDGKTDTKWCFNLNGENSFVNFTAERPVFVSGYRLATGGDTAINGGRNPKSWVLYGSASSSTRPPSASDSSWEVIAEVNDDGTLKAYSKCYFTFPLTQTTASKAYKHFKLNIRSVQSGNVCQLSEFDLLTDNLYFRNGNSGLWLQSNDRNMEYGTDRAELGSRGIDIEVVNQTDGVQLNPKFSGNHSINASNLEMGSKASVTAWTITAVEDSSDEYYIQQGESYLGADGSEDSYLTVGAAAENAKWKVYTRTARLAEMATANIDNPMDVSWLIRGGDFSKDDERFDAWTITSDGTTNRVNGGSKAKCNRIYDSRSYKTYSYLTQEITGIPNGMYKLTVEGVHINNPMSTYYFISSGDDIAQHELMQTESLGTISTIAYDIFTGLYHNDSDEVMLEVKNNTLTVGVKSDIDGSETGRFIADNFCLTYYDPSLPSAIESVHNNIQPGYPTGIFNLQGQQLSAPVKGINIINGRKVVVK